MPPKLRCCDDQLSPPKNPDCLEYLAVHEMTHLLERGHDERFTKMMNKALPDWRAQRELLNQAPLGHEEWVRP